MTGQGRPRLTTLPRLYSMIRVFLRPPIVQFGLTQSTPSTPSSSASPTSWLTPPPPTPSALRDLAEVISAVVFAGTGLDWNEPPSEAEPGAPVAYTSLAEETLAALEEAWEALVGMRGPNPRRLPACMHAA